jgi:hypothetical protein
MAVHSFSRQREEEMKRGREAVSSRMARGGGVKDFARMKKEADARLEEDEERRKLILENPEVAADKALRDIAGAAVQDQAQTLHEAILHLADREEPILDFRRQRAVDELEDETVDLQAARDVTTDMVRAQAVNQPTVLASEEGQETEDKPLNTTLFADSELSFDRVVLPPDELTPKNVEQADEAAEGMVPSPEQVVGDGKVSNDDYPETVEAVEVFEAAPDLSMSFPIPGDVDKRLVEGDATPKRRGRPRKNAS